MRDLITYSPDVTALLTEVATKMPEYLIEDDQGNPVGFAVTKAPTVRLGNETLSVVRCTADEVTLMKTLTSVKVIADVPAGGDLLAAMKAANRKIYDRIHDQTPQTVTLPDGTTQTITPPALIGQFA